MTNEEIWMCMSEQEKGEHKGIIMAIDALAKELHAHWTSMEKKYSEGGRQNE